jgi:tetratricopeptide (TPR) repeat protein
MNGVEFIVIECLKQKKWENALLHLNQLLNDENQHPMEDEKLLAYLLWRSQCYFELSRHEACIEDCRKIMKLLPNEAPRNNFWFKARWRLTHSLMQLRLFEEAKQIVEQLKSLCTDFTKQECVKLLERIEIGLRFTEQESDSKNSLLMAELGITEGKEMKNEI